MGDINWPTVIAVLVAIIGGGAGLAALSRSGADQSKTFSESAQIVVDLMKDQTLTLKGEIDELRSRTQAIEDEMSAVKHWGERVLDVLERAIQHIPLPTQEEFKAEAEQLRTNKPPMKVSVYSSSHGGHTHPKE
jgi:hypothetical protein